VEDGLIVRSLQEKHEITEVWGLNDALGIMQQIEALPSR